MFLEIGVEQSGCTCKQYLNVAGVISSVLYDAQCSAVWPDSTCSPSGVCNCPEGHKISMTKEGLVCHLENECPTNGPNSALYVRNSNRKSECYFFDRHGQELPGNFIGCEDRPELYDCIDGYCCPRLEFPPIIFNQI